MFPTLVHHYLSYSTQKYPDKTAVVCGKNRLSYSSLDNLSVRLASFIIQEGLEKQSRVIVFLDNSAESVISLFGILKAGCIFIILNGSLKAKQLSFILHNSDAECIITHVNKAHIVKEALYATATKCTILWIGEPKKIPINLSQRSTHWDTIFSQYRETQINSNDTNPAISRNRCIDLDLAALVYTSGSTGHPKGIMSSHRNMISAAQSIITYLENTSDDIILNVLPLSFDYGLYQVIMSVMFGGTVILEKNLMFLHNILKTIETENITGFPIVPTVVAMLRKRHNINKYNLNSLRYMTNTGAALPVEHIRWIREKLPHVRFFSMFGLTECKRVCYLPPEEIDRIPSSVGKAMPNCEVQIVDKEDREVKPGETGELIVRGSNVMRGYWKDPDLTAKVFRSTPSFNEKVLYTGDFFKQDENGFLYFLGRKDDIIKTQGERVSPKEIENMISSIPGVIENVIIGVPDELLGQAIKTVIVTDKKSVLTEKDILKYCANNLETFKVPKYVELVDRLPKTSHMKIDKKKL